MSAISRALSFGESEYRRLCDPDTLATFSATVCFFVGSIDAPQFLQNFDPASTSAGSRGAVSRGYARAHAKTQVEPPDEGGRHGGRPAGAQAAQGAIACGDVTSRCGGSVALGRASCRWQKTIGQAARTCRPPVVISPSKSP